MLAMGDLYVLIQKIDITNKLEDYLGDIRQDIPQIDTISGLNHTWTELRGVVIIDWLV